MASIITRGGRFQRISPVAVLAAVMFLAGHLASSPRAAAQEADDPFPGNPPVVPRWAFEPWVWEDTTNTQDATMQLVQGYLERGIPTGAVIIDSPWSRHYNDFDWDPERYPDPQGMIDSLHAQGVRVIVWITGFVNDDSPDFEEVKDQQYGVAGSQVFFWWKGNGIHVDFTNAQALDWWHSRMDRVLAMGIDGWKIDQSIDFLPDPLSTSQGEISQRSFKQVYYADIHDHTVARNPQAITFARTYSSHERGRGTGAPRSKVSVGWSGDYGGDFYSLRAQKNDVYEAALQGYGAPGVEIGGYGSVPPSKESLIRGAQFAALTPVMENGGMNGGETEHLPWFWDDETVEIYRYFATLHSELVPYLFSYGVEANLTGLSILRDPDKAKGHHRLGEELFASLILDEGEEKTVEFPAGGRWIDYWNEAIFYEGGTATNYHAPLGRSPIFLRAGAIIPLNVTGGATGHGDETSQGKSTVLVYPYGRSEWTFHRPLGEGTDYADVSIAVDESGGWIELSGDAPGEYRLRVKSFTAPTAVQGADQWYYDEVSQFIVIDLSGEDFSIAISGLMGYGSSGLEPAEGAGPADSAPVEEQALPAAFSEELFLPVTVNRVPFSTVGYLRMIMESNRLICRYPVCRPMFR